MKTVVGLVLVLCCGIAAAQPGATQPGPYQPNYPPPPSQYQPPAQVQITPEEAALLQRGEIDDGSHLVGIAASIFVGFGVGQAVQGRWHEKGYIFTYGELIGFTALFAGIIDVAEAERNDVHEQSREDRGTVLIVGGLVSLAVLRFWEIGDAIIAPTTHNTRVRALRQRLGIAPVVVGHHVAPYVVPSHDGGAVAGVSFHF